MTEENSNSQPIITDREQKMLVMPTSHFLKRCKKTCNPEDVYNLAQESLDYEMSIENFNETLNLLIESKSTILNAIRDRACLPLPKDNEHNEENHINEELNYLK